MRKRTLVFLCVILPLLLAGCGGGGSSENGSGDTVSDNGVTATAVTQSDVVIFDETATPAIVQTAVDEGGNQTLTLDTAAAEDLTTGAILHVPAGADERFPLGLSARVTYVTQTGTGESTLTLEPAQLQDAYTESEIVINEVSLDASNFIGVIAPDAVQALDPSAALYSAASSPDTHVFRNGAIIVRSFQSSIAAAISSDDVYEIPETVSLNASIALTELLESGSMASPSGEDSVFFKITGSLDNIKLVNRHKIDLNGTPDIEQFDVRVLGDLDFDIKLSGQGSAAFGDFSQAWEDVEEATLDLLGVTITGLNAADKIGKYPIAGLVWSVPCASGCTVTPGSTAAPIQLAKAGGIIIWVYLTASGEIELAGDLSLIQASNTAFNVGVTKQDDGDFELIREINNRNLSQPMVEVLKIDGDLGLELKGGVSLEADFFTGGIRMANAGADIVARATADYQGEPLSYGTYSLGFPWQWIGTGCFDTTLGAGAIVNASLSVGAQLDISWNRLNKLGGSFDYSLQIPTDEEMEEPGLHGLFYTLSTASFCVEDGINVDDNDQDGYTSKAGDCNDDDADIYPGAEEICGDGIDQDCSGADLACGGSSAQTFIVKQTGQTLSDTDYDDGYYQAGAARSYTRAGNIVTDQATGLMWQDDAAAAGTTAIWDNAISRCEDLSLGGYADWRLPTTKELTTIVNYGAYNPAIDSVFQNVAASSYWSSTVLAGDTINAWVVYFYSGDDGISHYKTSIHHVRCVR